MIFFSIIIVFFSIIIEFFSIFFSILLKPILNFFSIILLIFFSITKPFQSGLKRARDWKISIPGPSGFTNLNSSAIKGDDFPQSNYDFQGSLVVSSWWNLPRYNITYVIWWGFVWKLGTCRMNTGLSAYQSFSYDKYMLRPVAAAAWHMISSSTSIACSPDRWFSPIFFKHQFIGRKSLSYTKHSLKRPTIGTGTWSQTSRLPKRSWDFMKIIQDLVPTVMAMAIH